MSDKKKTPKRPRDINQRAASTVAIATGQVEDESEAQQSPEPTADQRHMAATLLGRKGGQTRAKRLTPEQRSEIAKKAAGVRWNKGMSTEPPIDTSK